MVELVEVGKEHTLELGNLKTGRLMGSLALVGVGRAYLGREEDYPMKNDIMQQVKETIRRHGGKVERAERSDGYHAYSIPTDETEWFDVWRWQAPFQILCHGTGPISEPEHKQRLHFGVWFHVPISMNCPHCGKLLVADTGKVK